MIPSVHIEKLLQSQNYQKTHLEMYSDADLHPNTNVNFCDLILEHLCAPQPGQRSEQTSRENMETLNASRNKGLGRKNNLKFSPAEMSALNWDRRMV